MKMGWPLWSSAKIVWRQDGLHRKEEERKTSAEAIGGASAAATTFSQGAFHLFSWNSISWIYTY